MNPVKLHSVIQSADPVIYNSKENLTNVNHDTATVSLFEDNQEEPGPRKFKNAVLSVMKRIRMLAKGVFEVENLPDPSELPIVLSNLSSPYSHLPNNESDISVDFPDIVKEIIDLNDSLSRTGTCVLYRDKKTKNCIVKDISNATSCCGFFQWYSCYHVMPDSAKIIILDLHLNIVQAFHSLLNNHTRAAPVWDSKKHQFVSMFTVTDFINFLHKYYVTDKSVLERISENTINDWRDMMETHPNTHLIHVSPEDNLRHAASVIVEHNIHRLPVIDPINGNVLAVITNSQLFRFFYERFSSNGHSSEIYLESFLRNPNITIPSYFKNKISELELGNYNNAISTIHPWQTLYDALDVFVRNHISVLPVIDEDHRLVDIYARYDVLVSLAETGDFQKLDWTISEALKLRKDVRPPCTCSKDDSFAVVLHMIYKAQVHRIFVVDLERHILGVISLTDILAFLCKV